MKRSLLYWYPYYPLTFGALAQPRLMLVILKYCAFLAIRTFHFVSAMVVRIIKASTRVRLTSAGRINHRLR